MGKVHLLSFSKGAATLPHGEGCFAVGLVGWWEYVLRLHRNFRAELPSNGGGGRGDALLFFHIQKAWWSIHVLHSCSGNVVFSSAILNVVDHSEKGMVGFDPDS